MNLRGRVSRAEVISVRGTVRTERILGLVWGVVVWFGLILFGGFLYMLFDASFRVLIIGDLRWDTG